MEIRCFADIPIEQDEPVSAVKQFVSVLRQSTTATEKSRIILQLNGISARATKTIQDFNPERIEETTFENGLAILEELTSLAPVQMSSLSFNISGEDLLWKGAAGHCTGKLCLFDLKAFKRKRRFSLVAMLDCHAENHEESFVKMTLNQISHDAGIRFTQEQSIVQFGADDKQCASQEQFFVTRLAWEELLETVGAKIRTTTSASGLPQLMTSRQSIDFRFDPTRIGKSKPVNFTRAVRRWLKECFSDYKIVAQHDGFLLQKSLAPGLLGIWGIDKDHGSFSKAFSAIIGIGLTSPKFAVASDRPFFLRSNLFRLFELGFSPMKWTYFDADQLNDALNGAEKLLRAVLPPFEAEAAMRMPNAWERTIAEFEGPRKMTAREAHQSTLPLAHKWAADAKLLQIQSSVMFAETLPYSISQKAPGDGIDSINKSWFLQFHSISKSETLSLSLPFHGPITKRHMPDEGSRALPSRYLTIPDGWIDSDKAIEIALKAAGISHESHHFPTKLELSGRAHVIRSDAHSFALGDKETAWRVHGAVRDENHTTTMSVTVPAFGESEPIVEMHKYDKHGGLIVG